MDGEVLTGRFAGSALSELSEAALQALAEELEADPDSLGLLLAYLDRRRGAAGEAGGGSGARQGEGAAPPTAGGEMSPAEALRVLGLGPGASLEEIRAAHRRLMKRVHPDLGGSDALAAMINAAKARLDP
jgi:DnaJ-domain-containing protein 1